MTAKLTREQIVQEFEALTTELNGSVSFRFNERGLAIANKFADRIMALSAISPEPDAFIVKAKSPGAVREFATLPGYFLAPDEELISERPLYIRPPSYAQGRRDALREAIEELDRQKPTSASYYVRNLMDKEPR